MIDSIHTIFKLTLISLNTIWPYNVHYEQLAASSNKLRKEVTHVACLHFLIHNPPLGNTFHHHLLQLLGCVTATKTIYFYPDFKSDLTE